MRTGKFALYADLCMRRYKILAERGKIARERGPIGSKGAEIPGPGQAYETSFGKYVLMCANIGPHGPERFERPPKRMGGTAPKLF